MRAPMNKTAIIGAKNIVQMAPWSAPINFKESTPEDDWSVLPNWMPAYTRKYIDARIIVHVTAGNSGIVSPSHEPAGSP